MNRDRLMQELDMVGSSVLAVPVTRIWCEEIKALILSLESELEISKQKIKELNVKLLRTKALPAPVEWKPGDEGDYFGHDPINGWFLCAISKSGKIEVWDHLREEMLEYGHIDDMEGYKFYRASLPEVGDGGES